MPRRRVAALPSAAPALPSTRGVQKRVKSAARGRKKSPPPSPRSVVPSPAPPSPQPPQRSSSSLTHCEQRAGEQRCSPRKRAQEEDATNSSLGRAARRARHDPEAAPQPPAAPQPQRETSSDDDNSSTTITKVKAEEETRVAAEGTALVSAAPPTKRRVLRHFETSLVLSTSTALTGPQKEKIIASLSRAGEGMMARARGDFVDTRCKGATPAQRAAVDERVRRWFDAGVHDGFKALYDVLNRHVELELPKALEMCAPPAAMRCHACRAARAHATDTRAIVCAPSAAGRTPPPTTSMARRGARSLRRCISSRSYGSSSGPSCRRAAVPSATPRTLRSAATYSRARTGAHSPSRAPPRVRVARCLCALIMPDVSLVLVQVVRRVLPEAAQDGGAGRRAQGAVLPVVPPRVPKDHGVARHAAAGRRVAGGALDARKPGPAAMRGLYAMALRYATPGGAEARRGGRGCASAVRAHI